ncbi:FAD-dependent oxidoreductase [Flaviaesturariibacter amylovorans]|uniref:FAD-dependent oxidoreductase n=1 Tax=Flaviaesturariibacter amylovorans TaxID=1084520 RepID=A0ABP8H481_9BACT
MQLHSPYTFSLAQYGRPAAYPALDGDRSVEVLILGTGISAALTAWELTGAGIPCLLLDKRRAATGSTAASTSLLQYEIDTPLHELAHRVGTADAERSYRLCYEAIDLLRTVCADAGAAKLFEPKHSLQLASYQTHVQPLREEFRLRRALGFDVEWLDGDELAHRFGLEKPAALWSRRAGQIDAYALAHRLLHCVTERGSAVHEDTEAVSIEHHRSGIEVRTSGGHRVRARKLVIACGYESQRYLPKAVEELFVTYALVTHPLPEPPPWQDHLLWETARPYLYSRSAAGGRLLIGGKDVRYDGRRYASGLPAKTRAILAAFGKIAPGVPVTAEQSWAGLFAGTADGLPYIGSVPEQPNTYYSLGFGGNGILFSVLGARIIAGLIARGKHPDGALFSFSR